MSVAWEQVDGVGVGCCQNAIRLNDTQYIVMQFGGSKKIKLLMYDCITGKWSVFGLVETGTFPSHDYAVAVLDGIYIYNCHNGTMYHVNMKTGTSNVLANPGDYSVQDYRSINLFTYQEQIRMIGCHYPTNRLIMKTWNYGSCKFTNTITLKQNIILKNFTVHTDDKFIYVIGGLTRKQQDTNSITDMMQWNSSPIIHQISIADDTQISVHSRNILPTPVSSVIVLAAKKVDEIIITGGLCGVDRSTRSLGINIVSSTIKNAFMSAVTLPISHVGAAIVLCHHKADKYKVYAFVHSWRDDMPNYLIELVLNYYMDAYLYVIEQLGGRQFRISLDELYNRQ